jgi:hypothetical protein
VSLCSTAAWLVRTTICLQLKDRGIYHIKKSPKSTMTPPLAYTPVVNDTTWHELPTERGTFTILSTCIVTLGLCLWTAVHPNLRNNTKDAQVISRSCFCCTSPLISRIQMLILGLFIPELVSLVWNKDVFIQLINSDRSMGFYAATRSESFD